MTYRARNVGGVGEGRGGGALRMLSVRIIARPVASKIDEPGTSHES